MRQRRETVEHPFGTIKAWMGANRNHHPRSAPLTATLATYREAI
jgi:hypothetical protein